MDSILGKIKDGRTDLVFDFLGTGNSPSFVDEDGVSLMQWCSYYGDVSAIKFLLSRGADLAPLGTTSISMPLSITAIGNSRNFCSSRERIPTMLTRRREKRRCTPPL